MGYHAFSAGIYSIKHFPRSTDFKKNQPVFKSFGKPRFFACHLYVSIVRNGATDMFPVQIFVCNPYVFHLFFTRIYCNSITI